jgi:uncharacterized protein YdiU (UPF0061 family)
MLAFTSLDWINRWAQLGPRFATPCPPTPLSEPHWVIVNEPLAHDLGLEASAWQEPRTLACMAGNAPPPHGQTWAGVYSGHQFGVWAGQLGDGRALWLGETRNANGCAEWQLKGAGPTPYSRRGDGRAVLRSSIREFLCSEAMHALGIPTTRALCLVASPDPVWRETQETAAVVCRVAPSFLRFGHLEHFAANDQTDAQLLLLKFVQAQHPALASQPAPESEGLREEAALALNTLNLAVIRTAELIAQWQAVGFCHGVMNTDNMSLLGLTLDYGPFQFLDAYDPLHICNHSDTQGRYAYGRQPQVAHWNLMALAHALHGLMGESKPMEQVLGRFAPLHHAAMRRQWALKLGLPEQALSPQTLEGLSAWVPVWLKLLARHRADYTLSWRGLSRLWQQRESVQTPWRTAELASALPLALAQDPELPAVLTQHSELVQALGLNTEVIAQNMLAHNPARVLRNHLAELAIRDAQRGDYGELHRLHQALQQPFDDHPDWAQYAQTPPDWANDLQISCSS